MTTFKTLTDEQRGAIKDLIDNRVWIALGKYSGALVGVIVILFGLIFYTYNQGESYTDERLNLVVRKTTELIKTTNNLQLMLKTNQMEIAYLKLAIADEKKKRELDIMDIRQLITTLGNN